MLTAIRALYRVWFRRDWFNIVWRDELGWGEEWFYGTLRQATRYANRLSHDWCVT